MIIHGEPGKSLAVVNGSGFCDDAPLPAAVTVVMGTYIWFPAYYDFVPIVVYDIDSNFLDFEAWLQANAPSATNIAETRSTVGNNLRCYVSPDDLPLMILRYS